MNEQELVKILSSKIKLVRSEFNYNQDEMASILGVSKKTIVQIEKERQLASWSVVVTFASLFRDSTIIQQELGEEDVVYLLQTIARKNINLQNSQKWMNQSLWKVIDEKNGFILQRHVITKYYRIVDQLGYRVFSSFYKKSADKHFREFVLNHEETLLERN
ncbi:helix-turn-helix transcriptional regulator [Piscibacillus sp. B03]|uniref:helix-turn-helix transcriptional regulator n=1 Tax=Piscibacillus sp. B03 TaxID=3457430 RepID=UPI003FCEC005